MKVYPKKEWGQCFLVDRGVLEQIKQNLEIADEYVVEIGSGNGELTDFLIEKARFLLAYEIDPSLASNLVKKYSQKKNALIQNQDFLKAELAGLPKKVVVGNIPYYITSEILFKLFENYRCIKKFFCVLQEEVAVRITANTNTKNYGKLSVVAQFFARCVYGFRIERTSFCPSPKVKSAFIKMYFKEGVGIEDTKKFLHLVNKMFGSPRKKLINNLKMFLPSSHIYHLYKTLCLSTDLRPQELSVKQYINIYNFLLNNNYI